MGRFGHKLHILFFPFMAHGHMIPTVDMVKLFAFRGHKATIITTPSNSPLISKSIQRTKDLGFDINIAIFKFPSEEVGLPEGSENLDAVNHNDKEMFEKFWLATSMLQKPLEEFLQECNPSCLVADMFFPWATDAAAKFGVPRLVFHGTCYFALCCGESIRLYQPHKNADSFVIPNLPGDIKMTASELPDFLRAEVENDFTKMIKKSKESELKSYGVIVNSFYELEPTYADHYKNVLGRKAWHIGPVSLCNRETEDKAQRGKEASIDEHVCLKWLSSKPPNSVIYICFGSLSNISSSQLKKIAIALEASGKKFIWVVRRDKNSEEVEWLPEGFEKRMEEKGMIIRGWAPQVLILEHEAVGGFVTHCGWNSVIEGVSAGKPMVAWPLSAEQFYNEKLVTQILKTGVGVGAKKWARMHEDYIESETIEKAIKRVMVGEEAEEMRSRARELADMARHAVEEGGSSYSDFNALVEELRLHGGR